MTPEVEREIHHQLGLHEARITSLDTTVARLHDDMDAILLELRDIHRTLNVAQGRWRGMISVSIAASAITAAVTQIVSSLQ